MTLVTADRGLRQRAAALGATVASPRWLLGLLDEGGAAPIASRLSVSVAAGLATLARGRCGGGYPSLGGQKSLR